jgi:hypothetical protein
MDDHAIENIAQVCHEANRAYCATLGDDSQPPWVEAPAWQRISAVNGVTAVLKGTITRPEQQHESWLAEKLRDGWVLGETKDAVLKTHPCCVPYAELPVAQQKKDALFFAIVQALRPKEA